MTGLSAPLRHGSVQYPPLERSHPAEATPLVWEPRNGSLAYSCSPKVQAVELGCSLVLAGGLSAAFPCVASKNRRLLFRCALNDPEIPLPPWWTPRLEIQLPL